MSGKCIVLTGTHGAGKDVQAELLTARLTLKGERVETAHVLKSKPSVAALRGVILSDATKMESLLAEALGFYTMHAESIQTVVVPSVKGGAVLVLNRAPETALVLNIYGRGLHHRFPWLLEGYESLMKLLSPDMVILLDSPVEVTIARMLQQDETDYIQQQSSAKHRAHRRFFLHFAQKYGWEVVNGSGTPEQVSDLVWNRVQRLFY